jgi:hypothetical protein
MSSLNSKVCSIGREFRDQCVWRQDDIEIRRRQSSIACVGPSDSHNQVREPLLMNCNERHANFSHLVLMLQSAIKFQVPGGQADRGQGCQLQAIDAGVPCHF